METSSKSVFSSGRPEEKGRNPYDGLPFLYASYGFGAAPEHDGIIKSFGELPEVLAALWEQLDKEEP